MSGIKFNNVVIEKRKTWDKDYYAKKAKEREELEMKEILNIDLDKIPSKKQNLSMYTCIFTVFVFIVLCIFYPHSLLYFRNKKRIEKRSETRFIETKGL